MKTESVKLHNVSMLEFASAGDVVFFSIDDLITARIGSIEKVGDAWRLRFKGERKGVLYSGAGECIDSKFLGRMRYVARTAMEIAQADSATIESVLSKFDSCWDIAMIERTEMAGL